MSVDNGARFSWLHIGDFHCGLKSTSVPWVTIRHELIEDIKKHILSVGHIDLVIFSGDFAQQGKIDEFEPVVEDMEEISNVIQETQGYQPAFFVVPGNHDLERPSKHSPISLAAKSYDSEPDMAESFFVESVYMESIKVVFKNYTSFVDQLSKRVKLLASLNGVMPGDCSASLDAGSIKVGLVGLNSTWSQLAGGDMQGKLVIGTQQLLSVTNDNPYSWAAQNTFNILVTHHPEDWFDQNSKAIFRSEIATSKIFDFHVFGHMHKNHAVEIRDGALGNVKKVQVAALFSLERDENNKTLRSHGYYFGEILTDSNQMRIRPREIKLTRGDWRAVCDQEACYDGDMLSFDFHLKRSEIVEKKQ